MSLRILHASLTIDPEADGLMENVRLLASVNRHLKHRIEVLTLGGGGASWQGGLDVPVHEVGAGLERPAARGRFMQWLREHAGGYDCVLVDGVLGFDAHRVWRALRAAGVPYFVFSPRYLGFLTGLERQLEKARQRFLWPWAGYPLFRDAHAVFFASEEAKREAHGLFWPYDCHEFVVPCGVPDGEAEADAPSSADAFWARHPELAGKRVFSVLAARHHGKPPEALLDAVRALIDAGRWDCDAMRLVFAGFADGGGGSEEALRHAVARRGLGAVVCAVGALDGDERRAMLQASEALVQPACSDDSGRAVAEAFAAGRPVLIAKGANLWREVAGNAAGFAEDDTRAGYRALFLRWLRESPEERAAFGANGRHGFEAHYNEQAAANTLLAVIYLLIGASQSDGDSSDPEIFRHEVDFL